jgi:hypothetical protein
MSTESVNRSPEQGVWLAHRKATLRTRGRPTSGRGCFGLALVVASATTDTWVAVGGDGAAEGGRVFVADRDVAWASLVDVPERHFRTRHPGPTHWATVRPTAVRYGMPALAYGGEGRTGWDFRYFPFDPVSRRVDGVVTTVRPGMDALCPADHPQLFRVFNCLEWAMTAHAAPDAMASAADNPRLAHVVGAPYLSAALPSQWVPRAQLGFAEADLGRLYDAVVRPRADAPPYWPGSWQRLTADALGDGMAYRPPTAGRVVDVDYARKVRGGRVLAVTVETRYGREEVLFGGREAVAYRLAGEDFEAGEPVAADTTARYGRGRSVTQRWHEDLPRVFGRERFDLGLRCWFDRQTVRLADGFVHLPAELASPAARDLASGPIYWDVTPCLDYFREDCDAFVFPPVTCRYWANLRGRLPGEVAYDLTPADARFLPPRRR